MFMFTFLILAFSPCIALAKIVQADADYKRCPVGKTFNSSLLQSVSTRSKLDCIAQCSQTADCIGVNVCPDTVNRRVDCTMLSELNPTVCDDLDHVNNTCFFAQKKCLNGGQPEGNKCKCNIGFGGDYCERYVRDCHEVYETNSQDKHPSGMYYIQPVNAPAPFWIFCSFSAKSFTAPLIRSNASFAKLDFNWNSLKKSQYQNDKNYFVGLENLHLILAQAEYSLHITARDNISGYNFRFVYRNFTVAGEVEAYAVKFSSYYADSFFEGNIFNGIPPIVFCTDTRDPQGCAATRGYPGWYGSDCSDYSLFAYPLILPIDGEDAEFEFFEMYLRRIAEFHQ